MVTVVEGDAPFILKQDKFGRETSCAACGSVTLMCPNCYATYLVRQSGQVSASAEKDIDLLIRIDYHIQCPECGEDVTAIILDTPIADAVAILNRAGYETAMCCSGHGAKDDYAFIRFAKVYEFEKLPKGWKLQGVFLRATSTDRDKVMKSLTDWANDLYR